jgi:hypothetical protein
LFTFSKLCVIITSNNYKSHNMKTLKKYLSLLLMAVGFISPAFAQHGGHHDGGNRSNNDRQTNSYSRQNNASSGHQNFSSRENNSSFHRQDRQTSFNQSRRDIGIANRGGGNNSSSYSRNHYTNNNNSFYQRTNRGGIQNNTARGNNTLRGNRGNYTGRYGYGQRGYPSRYSYAPRRYFYSGYPHYSVLPRTCVSISFGGYPYYYDRGLFYSYYNGFYEPVYAPFGIHVSILPFGYYPFYIGPTPYYYYSGVYYRDYGHSEYEVIDAPMGAVISELPKGAAVAMVNGEKFYEFNGTYYKEGVNSKNQVIYTVVGKNGEINNTDDQETGSSDQPLRVGDIVTTLPLNSRPVTIDGQNLFVSPDNIYFKQTIVNGNTSYEVVGTEIHN